MANFGGYWLGRGRRGTLEGENVLYLDLGCTYVCKSHMSSLCSFLHPKSSTSVKLQKVGITVSSGSLFP